MRWQNKVIPPPTLEDSLKRVHQALEEEPVQPKVKPFIILGVEQYKQLCEQIKKEEDNGR